MCCSNIFVNHSRFRLKQSICKARESMSQDPGIVKFLYFTTPPPHLVIAHWDLRGIPTATSLSPFPSHRWGPGSQEAADTWLWTWDREYALCHVISAFFPPPGVVYSPVTSSQVFIHSATPLYSSSAESPDHCFPGSVVHHVPVPFLFVETPISPGKDRISSSVTLDGTYTQHV